MRDQRRRENGRITMMAEEAGPVVQNEIPDGGDADADEEWW